jgi:hypothetical protein
LRCSIEITDVLAKLALWLFDTAYLLIFRLFCIKKGLMFVFFTSIIVNECRFLGFVREIIKLKTAAEPPKITERQIAAFASDCKAASGVPRSFDKKRACAESAQARNYYNT